MKKTKCLSKSLLKILICNLVILFPSIYYTLGAGLIRIELHFPPTWGIINIKYSLFAMPILLIITLITLTIITFDLINKNIRKKDLLIVLITYIFNVMAIVCNKVFFDIISRA